jgi:hypothetical protein
VVFQAGAGDLFPIVEILGADEADDGIHQQRFEGAGDGVGADFAGLLVEAVVRAGGEAGTLAGLEIHAVVADRAAFERERRVIGLRRGGRG